MPKENFSFDIVALNDRVEAILAKTDFHSIPVGPAFVTLVDGPEATETRQQVVLLSDFLAIVPVKEKYSLYARWDQDGKFHRSAARVSGRGNPKHDLYFTLINATQQLIYEQVRTVRITDIHGEPPRTFEELLARGVFGTWRPGDPIPGAYGRGGTPNMYDKVNRAAFLPAAAPVHNAEVG